MTKDEMAVKLAKKTGLTCKKSIEVIDVVFSSIKESLALGETVELRKFGVFGFRKHKAREARNPRTGELVNIPAQRHPRFKASKFLNAIINGEA